MIRLRLLPRALRLTRAAACLASVMALSAACASAPAAPVTQGLPDRLATPGFAFVTDTFAFVNQIRARHPDDDDLYANYCFVMARGLRQFFRFARFAPEAPRLDHDAYVERVRRITERAPWEAPLAAGARIVIPGYANLREFSRGEERAVKAGLGPRFWTLVHWTNWRVTMPVTGTHQAGVAREIVEDLGAGRLVQLLVTNWPRPELNHTVVAYAYAATANGLAFTVWDPNDAGGPGTIVFERDRRRFLARPLHDVGEGPIRVFRMYVSSLW
ncbi:MAG: hypothetical protein ACREJG_04115 [Candidatus Rokuibacteriota bacterium]